MNKSKTRKITTPQRLARYCLICATALEGPLSYLFRIFSIHRSQHNPNLCNRCSTHVQEGRIVKISVLFADIRSFTEMTQELGPQRTHEVTDAFLQMASDTLVKHGAYVDKYIGDSVMAFFNIPIQRNDHALQTVKAALEIEAGMLDLQEQFGLDLKTGVGIAIGWARVGRLGSKYSKDYTAIGDVVNLAARLEGHAKPGEILIHSEVYEEIFADFPDLPSKTLRLKGFQEPVLTYYLRNSTGISPNVQPQYDRLNRLRGNKPSRMAFGAVIFAILGAPCAAVAFVGPLATALGVGTLFGAITAQWMVLDAPLLRVHLLILAALGSLTTFYTFWYSRKLRQKSQANGNFVPMTKRGRLHTLIVIGLGAMTLIVIALGVAVHNFHLFI